MRSDGPLSRLATIGLPCWAGAEVPTVLVRSTPQRVGHHCLPCSARQPRGFPRRSTCAPMVLSAGWQPQGSLAVQGLRCLPSWCGPRLSRLATTAGPSRSSARRPPRCKVLGTVGNHSLPRGTSVFLLASQGDAGGAIVAPSGFPPACLALQGSWEGSLRGALVL